MLAAGAPSRVLFAFGAVSFAYFGYIALFNTYAPLWFQSLGYSALAIGALLSMQSATRVFGPYAWGWLADHSGQRIPLLRVAVGLALVFALGFLLWPGYGWVVAITVAVSLCTAGVVPLNEAALAQLVSHEGVLDARRYGRTRVWGSVGFVLAVTFSGLALQWVGIGGFPELVIALLGLLVLATLRLPVAHESAHAGAVAPGALTMLRDPAMAWFFAGVFFHVLAHFSLYAFLSLYMVALGYSKAAVGLIWGWAVAVEVIWFWFQGRWLNRISTHGWLMLAALVMSLRCAALAAFGGNVWALVLAQSTHALTFAAQHTACIAIINRHFTGRLRGRGQALYSVFGYGASGVIGGVAGGVLTQTWGYSAVFWAASVAAMLAALCNWRALFWERRVTLAG